MKECVPDINDASEWVCLTHECRIWDVPYEDHMVCEVSGEKVEVWIIFADPRSQESDPATETSR